VVFEFLNDLQLLLLDLNKLVAEYTTEVPWLGTKVQEIEVSDPRKMATDQKYLYIICSDRWRHYIGRYILDTLEFVDKFHVTSTDWGALDVSGNELYVSDNMGIKILNINTKDIIRQWYTSTGIVAIKFHDGNLYCASHQHVISLYNLSGDLLTQFGKKGTANGELDRPYGIDVDDKFIYVGDYSNNRVQVFDLKNYTYSHQWGSYGTGDGKFQNPFEILLYNGLIYVGDDTSIQGFTKDGQFLARFGKTTCGSGTNEFYHIRGMVIVNNRIYISDYCNSRIVVLQ